MQRSCEHFVGASLLDDLARIHHRDPVGDLRHDGQAVRDEDQAPCRARASGQPAARGPAPGSSRRAPWSARRRSAGAGRWRSPWRSWRAGACRRTARAERRVRGSADRGCRPASAAPTPASMRPRQKLVRCACTASAICAPTRCTGLRLLIGSWKIIAMAPPRSRRSSASSSRSTSCPSSQAAPATTRATGGNSP